MLPPDDPHTPYIFEAAGYLDLIRTQCGECCQQPYAERLTSFAAMRQECASLRALAAARFADHYARIAELLDGIGRDIDRLAGFNLPAPPPGCCTVCYALLEFSSTFIPGLGLVRWCSHCMAGIYQRLQQLEQPMGLVGT